MAVTLTVQELAVGLRIDASPTVPVEEPHLGLLTRSLAVATAYIERRAPTADSDTQNEAVVRICGWLYDSPSSGNRTVQGAYLHSGAAGLLSPYVDRRAEAI